MKKITVKTRSIMNLSKQKGDEGILDLMDFIYRGNIYDWLSDQIENLSDEDKDELLDELESDIDRTILYIDKKEFIKWYLDSLYDFDKTEFELVKSIITKLIKNNKIKLENLLQEEKYIPIHIVKNKKDIRKKDMTKIDKKIEILIKKYRLEWTNKENIK
jgi:hypothetical protein